MPIRRHAARATTAAAILASLTAMVAAHPAEALPAGGVLDGEHLRANDVVVDPDGRLVTATTHYRETEFATEAVLALAAYTPDGQRDESFGAAGVAFINANPKMGGSTGDEVTTAVVHDPVDGGYVAVGTTPQEELGFVVTKFSADGIADDSFGDGGVVVDDLGAFSQRALAVAVDAQGRIVVVGTLVSVTPEVPSGIAVVRYERDGSRDTSFGAGGLAVVPVGASPAGNDLVLLPDSSIVVAGRGGGDAVAAHLLENGTLDPRFGTAGVSRVDFGGSADEATSIVQQGLRGRFVLAGSSSAGPADVALAGLTFGDGQLDTTFGDGGRTLLGGAATVERGNDLAVDDDCGLVVAADAAGDLGVARLTPAGVADGAFGDGGLLRIDTGVDDGGTDQDQASGIAVAPDGSYVVAGSGGNADLALQRVPGQPGAGGCPSPFGEGPLYAIGDAIEEGDSGQRLVPVVIALDAPEGFVSVQWELRVGTADHADFGDISGSLTLSEENPAFVVEIPINGDLVDEPDETFTILAELATGPRAGARAEGTITILDDDEPGSTPPPDPGPGPGPAPVEEPPPPAEDGCAVAAFVDVAGDNVHREAIDCLTELGLLTGTTATTFSPEVTLTRGQAASLFQRLVVARGGSVLAAPPDAFTDDDGSVHETAIDQMAAIGIVTGRGDGTFGPDEPVRRDQFASLLVRAYEAIVGDDLFVGPDAFVDDNASPHELAIDAATHAGLVEGTGFFQFSPNDPVRRDQAASFVHRLWLLLES